MLLTSLPHPLSHSLPALAGLWHPVLGLRRLLAQRGVTEDLAQGDLRGALLRLLLGAAHLAGPAALGPLTGKSTKLHGGLVASGDLQALVHSLALLQVPLRDLHAQGVELRLRRYGRVILLLLSRSLALLLCGGLGRAELGGRGLLLLRDVLLGPQGLKAGRIGEQSLLSCRLFRLFRAHAEMSGILLPRKTIQLHDGLVLVAEPIHDIDDVLLRHRSLAVPLAELVESSLVIHGGIGINKGRTSDCCGGIHAAYSK
mmetsp:Transcript_31428/g.90737  ORF Transcript_31428/g.90737 Transcript_31428/m.90737 type:complete len:257 (+) Transcript_31428:416-1186(+)